MCSDTSASDGRRVLVLEDEYFLADELARVLIQLGAKVVGPVPTLTEALALLDTVRVDAAVLDVNVRGEMAFPLADALQARDVPFVFATGYDQSMIPLKYAAVPRWEKPFDSEALARTLPGLVRA